MENQIAELLQNSRRCAVLTGAGISAESGVPTFRGEEGLWGKFRPEELASMDAFMANPKMVWEWYNWRRQLMGDVKPNPGHHALADLEQIMPSFWVITQNVDGLHKMAGSGNILELHGNIHRNKCVKCNQLCGEDVDIDPDNIPTCTHCGGQLRPDVVWFGEMLDPVVINRAFAESEQADVFLSVGTSAVVHPAASLPMAARSEGAKLVEINPEPTPLTDLADISVRAKSGEFLPRVVEIVREHAGRG
ncbi:NAD-dependent protein deacylase [candidate division GN15 bacterium]|nr:NAD-dependent protein deacylase [candidate division GN15 bacterium]